MRPGSLMWLLGAGASASSGIPTAWEMLWEFKQALYVSQRKVWPKSVEDLTNPAVRSLLQSYVPRLAPFQLRVHLTSTQRFLRLPGRTRETVDLYESKTRGAKPSYGHMALATLLKANHTCIIWTTNFDDLVDDACAKVFDSTSNLNPNNRIATSTTTVRTTY